MNVIVCVKQIPDPALPGELDPSTNTLKRDGKLILDESDSYGVEMALQLVTTAGGGEVSLVSMAPNDETSGLRTALAMGAEAVSMGTRFMATREAPIHESLKHRLVEATELDTQLIFRRFRNTARVFKNSVAEKVAEIESRRGAEFVDVAELVAGEKGAAVLESGDLELGIFWAGLSSGLVYDVPTVAELVSRIIVEAEEIINLRLRSLSQPSTAE